MESRDAGAPLQQRRSAVPRETGPMTGPVRSTSTSRTGGPDRPENAVANPRRRTDATHFYRPEKKYNYSIQRRASRPHRAGAPCGACVLPRSGPGRSLAVPRWAGAPRAASWAGAPRAATATPSDVRSRGHAAQAGSPAPPAPHRCVLKTAREAARATTATRTPRRGAGFASLPRISVWSPDCDSWRNLTRAEMR